MWAEDEFDLEEILADEQEAPQIISRTLIEASQNNNSGRISEIFSSPEAAALIDINDPDETGSTPLLYACCYSAEGAVLELLRNGANPNSTDSNEWSPLMWAVQNNSVGIVQRLVEQGADVSYKTSSGRSAPSMAVQGSSVYEYFAANQLIDDAGPSSFYVAATDPTEEEAKFQAQLDESSRALGIQFHDLDETCLPHTLDAAEDQDEFDWTNNKSSFPVPPRLFPKLLDLVVTTANLPFQKGSPPAAANTLFLVIRHYCYNPNEQALVGLVTSAIQRISNIAENKEKDLKALVYWLSNVHALLFYLQHDPTTNRETVNFQQNLNDLLEKLYLRVIEVTKTLISPLLKPCILDYENIPGIDSIKYKGDWSLWRKREVPEDNTPNILPPSLDALRKPAPRRVTSILSSLLVVLRMYSVHPVLIQSMYSQVLYWIGAKLFNSILGSHKYMARVRAMQIRLNISNIEDWALNNNTRPSDDVMHQGPPTYKSLDQLCRAHFSCTAEMLQWLQCFSGFGNDFTNVIATMQELKELNPKQLLYAFKHYRSEVNEPTLSKEYKEYLQDLEQHYASSEQKRTDGTDLVLLKTPPIISYDILLDEKDNLGIHLPSYKEMLWFWGGGADGTDTQNAHYFRPTVPAEISDELDTADDGKLNIYDPLDMPTSLAGAHEPEW